MELDLVVVVILVVAVVLVFGGGFYRGWLARRGRRARAEVLSVREDVVGSVRLGTKRFTIVYEVHPEGQPSFHARGREVMDFAAQRANPLNVGVWVAVRFHVRGGVVVLDRVATESVEDMVRREDREKRLREEALLREPPRS